MNLYEFYFFTTVSFVRIVLKHQSFPQEAELRLVIICWSKYRLAAILVSVFEVMEFLLL